MKEPIIKALLKENDTDAAMARVQLNMIINNCKELLMFMDEDEDLEPWLASKITIATDYIDTVHDYYMNEEDEDEEDEDEEDMETEY